MLRSRDSRVGSAGLKVASVHTIGTRFNYAIGQKPIARFPSFMQSDDNIFLYRVMGI